MIIFFIFFSPLYYCKDVHVVMKSSLSPCESYEIIKMIVATTKSQSEISLMQDVGSNQWRDDSNAPVLGGWRSLKSYYVFLQFMTNASFMSPNIFPGLTFVIKNRWANLVAVGCFQLGPSSWKLKLFLETFHFAVWKCFRNIILSKLSQF